MLIKRTERIDFIWGIKFSLEYFLVFENSFTPAGGLASMNHVEYLELFELFLFDKVSGNPLIGIVH